MKTDDEFLQSLTERKPGPGDIFQYTVFQCVTTDCQARKAVPRRNTAQHFCQQHSRHPMKRVSRVYEDKFGNPFRFN